MNKPSWEVAAEFFNRVRVAVEKATQEQLEGELRRLEALAIERGEQLTANPIEVLTDLIAREVGDPHPFELVEGTLGVNPHRWYEWNYVDKVLDPLPFRWIVDPVPIGGYSRPAGWTPTSPFLVLYIKEVDRSKEQS